MGCQQYFQIGRIDPQQIAAALHSRCCAGIAVRYSKASAFIIYKTVKRDLSFRAEIESDRILRNHPQLLSTYSFVYLLRDTIHSTAVGSVLFVAPCQRLSIQICKIIEHPVSQKVVFYKTNQPLHLALGKGMPRLAKLGLKGKSLHKGLVVFLPDRMPLQISVQHHTLHVVS